MQIIHQLLETLSPLLQSQLLPPPTKAKIQYSLDGLLLFLLVMYLGLMLTLLLL